MLCFVGSGDQKKFTKNPRHFSMQNSQANTKKLFTKCFWTAGEAILCVIVPYKGSHSSAHAGAHASVHEVVSSYVTWSVFTCSVPYPYRNKKELRILRIPCDYSYLPGKLFYRPPKIKNVVWNFPKNLFGLFLAFRVISFCKVIFGDPLQIVFKTSKIDISRVIFTSQGNPKIFLGNALHCRNTCFGELMKFGDAYFL